MQYLDFLETKKKRIEAGGFDVDDGEMNPILFDFQKYITRKALQMGKYAMFTFPGSGKTFMQAEWAKHVTEYTGLPVLILAPLAVAGQTIKEAAKMGIHISRLESKFLGEENRYEHNVVAGREGIYITNYEQLDNIDTSLFVGIVLDESSILKNFTGVIKNKIIDRFETTRFKLCCTATPAPNDLNEIGNHSQFLNVLDAQDMRSKWFVRDEGMNNYRLKGHAKQDFFAWISSWSTMCMNPADLGFDGSRYVLPPLNIEEIAIETEKRDNGRLFNDGIVNATNFNRELRMTMQARLDKVVKLVRKVKDEQFIVWVKQNAEADYLRVALGKRVDFREVRGSDSTEEKEKNLLEFAEGKFRVLITKTKICQFGLNFQGCRNQIFTSSDFSFEGPFQAIRRSWRFGQDRQVNIYIVVTDTMQNVINLYKQKEAQFMEMQNEMNKNVNENRYGLKDTYEFREVKNDRMWLMKGDTCQEIKRLEDNSMDFGIWSPPFSSLFTYSNYIHDMGNNDSHAEFFKQYAFLLKDIYRIIKPGRLVACHTKNLGVYKNSSGYTGMYDFTKDHTTAMEAAGFKLHCIITIWTDPVLEMQRTKTQRLLYKQVTSDSSYTGVGMPEFIYVFRKWEGDEKEWNPIVSLNKQNFPLDDWQEWASPVYRERLLNYEKHDLVKALMALKAENFRLKYDCNPDLPDHWYDDVWFDIRRTDVLNGQEGTDMGDEKHIAPLQLEVIRRCVKLWSNQTEKVFTPFLGIGSEAYVSLKEGRIAVGCELKDSYFDVAVRNCNNVLASSAQLSLM